MAIGVCRCVNSFIWRSTFNQHRRFSFPGAIRVLSHRQFSKMSNARYMDFDYTDNQSGFKVRLPGWSIDDMNLISRDLRQPNYLRTFRVFYKLEQIREIAKGQGFLGILEFEKTEATYMKCLDLERCVSLPEMHELARRPYGYDLIFESRGGRIGKSSFQIDNFVRVAETGKTLFQGALVYVTVDYKTKKPIPNPPKWVEKYSSPNIQAAALPPLRLSLQTPRGTETTLHRSDIKIRYAEVDRFGHTNNIYLNEFCADALLECYSLGKIPAIPSVEVFETVRRVEVDFVGESTAGDVVTAVISQDSAFRQKLFCKLYNKEQLIYVQALEYDNDITTDCGKL